MFQAQCLRASITRFADGAKLFSQRVSTISEAEKEIAGCIPVVPTQLGRKEYQGLFLGFKNCSSALFLWIERMPYQQQI